jgi:hypothetical protein
LRPQVAGDSCAQDACGSTEPVATGTQVPIEPASVQDRQAPVQALAQQTPSMQYAEAHSLEIWQGAPRGFRSVWIVPPVPPPPAPPVEAPPVPPAPPLDVTPPVPALPPAPAPPLAPVLPPVPAFPLGSALPPTPALPLVPASRRPTDPELPAPASGPPSDPWSPSGRRPQPAAASVSQTRIAAPVRNAVCRIPPDRT